MNYQKMKSLVMNLLTCALCLSTRIISITLFSINLQICRLNILTNEIKPGDHRFRS